MSISRDAFRRVLRAFLCLSFILVPLSSVFAAMGTTDAPAIVSVPSSSSSGSFRITWSEVAGDVTYSVQERVNGGAWNIVGSSQSGELFLTGRTNGTYQYGVRAWVVGLKPSAYNNSGGALVVSLSYPSISISATPSSIPVNGTSNLSWNGAHAATCTLNGAAVEPIGTSQKTGISATTSYTLSCSNPLGSASQSATITVVPPPVISGLSASPNPVTRGNPTSLSWSATNATSCAVDGNAAGSPYSTPPLAGDKTFTVTCSGIGGTDSKSVFVQAPPPPLIHSFTATNNPIETGTIAKLNWTTSGTTSCTLNGDAAATSASNHSTTPLNINTVFTLTCNGVIGQVSSSLTVTVAPKTILNNFSIDANPIASGQATTVRWSVSNVKPGETCKLNDAPVVDAGSATTGALTSTKTYRLVCPGLVNTIDQTRTLTVNPAPTISSFTADKNPIVIGQSTTVRWTTANTIACELNDGAVSAVPTSGTRVTGTLSTSRTYRLSCSGTNASSTSADLIVVATAGAVATLTSAFSHVEAGSSTTLTWSSENATTCSLSVNGVAQGVALSGSQSTGALNTNTAYILTCSGNLDSIQRQLTVQVVPVETLWRTIGQCDPKTGQKRQRCGDARGCAVNALRSVNGNCAQAVDCQP